MIIKYMGILFAVGLILLTVSYPQWPSVFWDIFLNYIQVNQ